MEELPILRALHRAGAALHAPPAMFAVVCIALALPAGSELHSAAGQEAKKTDPATRHYAAAAALQNREQYELAADEWAKFLAAYPHDAKADRAQHYLGICRLKTKQYAQALDAFQKVVATYPKSEVFASAWLHLGLAQYNLAQAGQAEMYAKAAETFAAVAAKYPQGKEAPQALFYGGEALYAQGKKEEAARLYAQVTEKFPKDPLAAEALYALGVTEQELNRPAAAGAAFDAYLKQFAKGPLAAEVTLRRGETLLAQGQFDVAEKWFAAVAGRKGFALADLATLRQATCLYERRKYAEAAALYKALPARFPDSQYKQQALLAAGKCAYLAGQVAEAREGLTQVLAAGGSTAAEAAHWLARSLLKQQQPAEALKVVESALPHSGDSPYAVQLQLDKADALYDLPERRRESVPLFAQIAQQHPQDAAAPQALYMAAFASLETGDHAAAQAHAAAFLQQYADHELVPDVVYVVAESDLLTGKYAEASQLYDTLLSKHAARPEADTWRVRRGLVLFLEKKYDQTVAALRPVVPKLKNEQLAAEAHYLVGASENELKHYEAAVRSLKAALSADPKGRHAEEALLALASAVRQLNQFDLAQKHLAQFIEQFPNSRLLDRAHHRRGEYAYASGDYASAAAEYRVVVQKFPQSPLVPHALYGLGWTQLSQGDAAAAAQTLDGLLAKYPQGEFVPRARYARALAREQLKEFAPALDDLQAFLQTHPQGTELSDARYVLGLCQAGLNEPAEAEATFRKLLADDPQYVGADKVEYEMGWALKSQDKTAEAVEAFGNLARRHADSPLAAESLYHVGEFHYQQGEFKPAAAAYYEASQKAGKSELGEKAAHKLGWAYFRQDAFDKAQHWFSYQRANFPQGPLAADAAFMEAESLFKQGKYRESLSVYEQVKNPRGKDFAVLALLHAGQAEGKLKQWARSLVMLETAARQFPDSAVAADVLYEQGWALQNLGKLDEALKLYEEVTAQTDREVAARARFMVGEIYFERKNHAEAVKNFFKAAYGYSYPEWQANAQYEAGRCFEVLNKKDQARKSYQEVVDKFPQSDKAKLARERLDALGK